MADSWVKNFVSAVDLVSDLHSQFERSGFLEELSQRMDFGTCCFKMNLSNWISNSVSIFKNLDRVELDILDF